MSQTVLIGIAQIAGKPFAVEINRKRAAEAIVTAFENDADMVVLPEMVVHG